MALGKVYSFGPTFRAEKSKTRRHLTEFWMVEPEIAYGTLDDMMELAEGFLTLIVKRCLEHRRPDLQTIGRDLTKLEKIEPPFPRITYDEAVQNCRKATPKANWKTNSNGEETSARPTKPISHRNTTSPSWSIVIPAT